MRSSSASFVQLIEELGRLGRQVEEGLTVQRTASGLMPRRPPGCCVTGLGGPMGAAGRPLQKAPSS
eukprot:6447475-Amphidinium_carterae.1